jgi:hypothetical protein
MYDMFFYGGYMRKLSLLIAMLAVCYVPSAHAFDLAPIQETEEVAPTPESSDVIDDVSLLGATADCINKANQRYEDGLQGCNAIQNTTMRYYCYRLANSTLEAALRQCFSTAS